MKKSLIVAGIVTLAFLMLSCRPAANSNAASPDTVSINMTQPEMIGKLAPDFQLNDLSGKQVVLSSFQGKPILVVFWATWSPEALKELPIIQQVYNDATSKGFVVVTVDLLNSRPEETEANVTAFMSSNDYSFPVVLDPSQIATIQYHVGDLPTNVVIDKNGFLREITEGAYDNATAVETSLTAATPK